MEVAWIGKPCRAYRRTHQSDDGATVRCGSGSRGRHGELTVPDTAEHLAQRAPTLYLLYLLNISFLPGLAFLLQIRQYYRCKSTSNTNP